MNSHEPISLLFHWQFLLDVVLVYLEHNEGLSHRRVDDVIMISRSEKWLFENSVRVNSKIISSCRSHRGHFHKDLWRQSFFRNWWVHPLKVLNRSSVGHCRLWAWPPMLHSCEKAIWHILLSLSHNPIVCHCGLIAGDLRLNFETISAELGMCERKIYQECQLLRQSLHKNWIPGLDLLHWN